MRFSRNFALASRLVREGFFVRPPSEAVDSRTWHWFADFSRFFIKLQNSSEPLRPPDIGGSEGRLTWRSPLAT